MIGLEISQPAEDKVTIRLNEKDGARIRDFILQRCRCSFNVYVKKIGLHPSNVSDYLRGEKRLSLKTLRSLMAGVDIEITCNLDILMENQVGNDALSANSQGLDDSLYLDESEQQEDITLVSVEEFQRNISSSLEKHPENRKIIQEPPSKENQEES